MGPAANFPEHTKVSAHTPSCEAPGNKIRSVEGIKLTCFLLLAPTCYPALVPAAGFMGRGRQADGLDEVAHGVRPRRAQLQQRDVVVVVPAVVVLMDYDPPHCRHKLGTALHLHAQVGTPCSGVSQPGWEQRRLFLKKYLKTPTDSRSGERGAQHLHVVQTLEPKGTCGSWPCLG